MVTSVDYKRLSRKVERLEQELEELQQVLQQWQRSAEKGSEKAWQNLVKLTKEVSARWQGPDAVEEIKNQRDKDLKAP